MFLKLTPWCKPFWEAQNSSADEEIPHIFWSRVYKIRLVDPILNQMGPAHTCASNFFKTQFNYVIPFNSGSPRRPSLQAFQSHVLQLCLGIFSYGDSKRVPWTAEDYSTNSISLITFLISTYKVFYRFRTHSADINIRKLSTRPQAGQIP